MTSSCQKIDFGRKVDFFENFQKSQKWPKRLKIAILALFDRKSKIFKNFHLHLKSQMRPQNHVFTDKTRGSNHQRLEKLPNLRFGFFLNSWSLKSYADHCQDASGALSSAALSPFAPKLDLSTFRGLLYRRARQN